MKSISLFAALMAALLLFGDLARGADDRDDKKSREEHRNRDDERRDRDDRDKDDDRKDRDDDKRDKDDDDKHNRNDDRKDRDGKSKREKDRDKEDDDLDKRKEQKAREEKARQERELAAKERERKEREKKEREQKEREQEERERREREQRERQQREREQKAQQEQRARQQSAAANLAEADADFAWQGEYEGCVHTPGAGQRQLGLQVVALGDGAFDAVAYSGGLPGAGWDRNRKTALSGKRSGALLTMSGELLLAEVQPTHAVLRDTDGRRIGTLQKVFRGSPTMGKSPSPGAIVLFDGTSTDAFDGGRMTDDGLLMAGGTTKQPVQDFYLHLEFRTPYMPYARGQGRGNSGVYIQRRYEVQILDSFGLPGEINECGALYRQKSPDVNMALPPLSWQTYDIYFTAARFDTAGNKVIPARIIVLHNGVAVHSNHEIVAKTGVGQQEGPAPLPILLQFHGNPVVFRNIWLAPLVSNASCP